MAIQYSTTHRTNSMTQLNTDIGVNALIKIYSGAAPANVAAAATGTLLVTLTGNATAFGSASAGALTAGAITSGVAAATGAAGYFRIATSGGTDVVQGTVNTSGADITINNTSIASGQTVSASSLVITATGA